ncbi:ribonuclease H-like domain-containing protein [Mycena crocata]|nr:ribonuclease H-like domain-containing protein [Mycena crocata]
MAWIKVPPTGYTHVSDSAKVSHCQIEVVARYAHIQPQPLDEATPPLRILSFDVECLGREGVFPQPDVDSVIQISNMVSILGIHISCQTTAPFIRNVFTFGTCSSIPGATVLSYDDEALLLQAWSDFVRQADPDLIIGFNIGGFDLPYLLDRAAALHLPQFPFLGRLKDIKTTSARTLHYTVRGHMRTWEDIPLPGRLQLDLMQYVRCEVPPYRNLSLNAVATRFLGEKKEDVHFTAIPALQTGSADSRRLLAVYCLKDAYLPMRLLEEFKCDAYTRRTQEKRIQFNNILPEHVKFTADNHTTRSAL